MILKCGCGKTEAIGFHKDGYEAVKFICLDCRAWYALKPGSPIPVPPVSNFRRVTLQNGDLFFIPSLKKAS